VEHDLTDPGSGRRLLVAGMALAILALVVVGHPASDPAVVALALAVPGALPFVVDALRARRSRPAWLLAAQVAGALATVVLLVVHQSAYAAFSPFLLVLLAAGVGMALPARLSVPLILVLAATPQALNLAVGSHVPFAVAVGTALSWLAGVGIRAQGGRVRDLWAAQASVAERAATGERRRLARDIHDLVSRTLSVTMLHLTGARLSLAPGYPSWSLGPYWRSTSPGPPAFTAPWSRAETIEDRVGSAPACASARGAADADRGACHDGSR
jgi:signal transduction histidine kinase